MRSRRESACSGGPRTRTTDENTKLEQLQLEFASLIEKLRVTGVCEVELVGQEPRHPTTMELLDILVDGGTLRVRIHHDLVAVLVDSIHTAEQSYQRHMGESDAHFSVISSKLNELASLRSADSRLQRENGWDTFDTELRAIEGLVTLLNEFGENAIEATPSLRRRFSDFARVLAGELMPSSVAATHVRLRWRLKYLIDQLVESNFPHSKRNDRLIRWTQVNDPQWPSNHSQSSSIVFSIVPAGDAYMIDCMRQVVMDWMDGHSTLEETIERLHQYASLLQSMSEKWYRRHHKDLMQLKRITNSNEWYLTRHQMQDFRLDEQLERVTKLLQRRWGALHHVTTRWWYSGADINRRPNKPR